MKQLKVDLVPRILRILGIVRHPIGRGIVVARFEPRCEQIQVVHDAGVEL